MKKITRESLAATARDRYIAQFVDLPATTLDPKRRDAMQRVVALPERPTVDQVNAAIGNESWTTPPACFECKEVKDEVIEFPAPYDDYESHPCYVCGWCLIKALNVMEE